MSVFRDPDYEERYIDLDEYFTYEKTDFYLYQNCILKKKIMHFEVGDFVKEILVEEDYYLILFDGFGNGFGIHLL